MFVVANFFSGRHFRLFFPYRSTLSCYFKQSILLSGNAVKSVPHTGDYHLDNNLVERLNIYISLSRRNSLFFGSHTGTKRAAMFYSLACSCRLQGVNFFEYISDVINKAATLPPRTPISKYRELLPDKWKQKNIAQE